MKQRWIRAMVLLWALPLLAVPACAAEGGLTAFLLGSVEGIMLLALLLTILFMAAYVAWRNRKKK